MHVGDAGGRATRWVRAVPAPVWAVTLLFGCVLALWSSLAPVGRAPDEPAHVDLVLLLADGGSYPDYDDLDASRGTVAAGLAHSPGFEVAPGEPLWLTPEAAPPRADRDKYDELGGDDRVGTWPNQMPQHPPLYYWLSSAGLRVERALWPSSDPLPLDREWHLLRLLNVGLLLPLPVLAWATAHRLGASRSASVTAAVALLAIPELTHIGAVVNNDNLLALLAAALAVLLAGVLRGDTRRSTAAAVGVVAGLALLTKAFALVLVPWIVAVYAWRAWRDRPSWRPAATALVVAAVPTALLGGAWPVRNLVRHGEPFPNIADQVLRRRVPGVELDLPQYLTDYGASMVHRFWGHLGWFEAPMREPVVVALSLLALAAAVAAFLRRGPRLGSDADHPGPSRQALAVLALVVLGLFAFLLVMDLDRYRLSGQHGFMQGRYLFAAVVPFVVVVGVGAARLLGRWAAPVVLGIAVVAQAEAVRAALDTWWAEPDASLWRSVHAMAAWSPWPEPLTVLLASATAAAAVATAVLLIRPPRPSGVEAPVVSSRG